MGLDLDAIRAREQAATPGPWEWYGSTGTQNLYLSTVRFGRQLVMSFKRWGMRSSQPEFAVGRSWKPNPQSSADFTSSGVMTDAKDLTDRSNVVGLNHPDAVFIAAARADVADLLALVDEQQAEIERLRAIVQPEAASKIDDLCGATATFWPDDEACEAECVLVRGHRPADVHSDRILGEWSEDELLTSSDQSPVVAQLTPEAASPLSDHLPTGVDGAAIGTRGGAR